MNLLIGMIGLVAGLIISDIMNEERVKAAKEEAQEARCEHLSAIEHEAHLREDIENLREANEYFKAVNARRHIQ